jgi:putative salt-induced outer membrane protein
MSKPLALTIPFLVILLLASASWTSPSFASDRASDFFKDPSRERDLLKSLFDKYNRPKAEINKDKPFSLAGEAGVLITTGNTETSIIKLAFESNHETESWSNRYEGQFLERTNTLQRDSGNIEIDTRRLEVSAQFDYKLLEPNNRLFAYLEYDDNEFNRLREQATLVLGWSQVAWKSKSSEFRYSIGPGYSHFIQGRTDTRIEEMIVRGTLFYNYAFNEGTRFRQTFSAEVGEQIIKSRSQSSITAKIFDKLALKFSVNLIYNDNVSAQDSVLSTQSSISMVYQFF